MKLIGSLTSPYVRKIRVMLLEKNMPFEFIVDSPWEPSTHVPDFNPLGKVPALVTDDGQTLFDSNILAEYIELASTATPQLLPTDRHAALHVRQLVALADGICDAGINIFLEGRRPADKQYADWVERQQGKIARGLDALERRASTSSWLGGKDMNLADIAAGCVLLWFDLRAVTPGDWRETRPNLASLVAQLAQRSSFQQTAPVA
ncbi:MAG: glutathione S-transferase [Rhodocyclales bacterium]|nr:glutathione S-transferase [Rhodocyclales bacterium]MDB5887800.1 glutathione S-transferase [Rhodocyclales bacterium]